ncbi:MAG: SUMF1/EgtB/PvdO family nonheme iron enzyme [Pseudomonadota bacterium]
MTAIRSASLLLVAATTLLLPARSGGQLEDLVLVLFESEPEGARLLMDGTPLCGTEGGCTRTLTGGPHKVRMELDGYLVQEAVLELQDGQVVRWILQPNFGWLSVETDPSGLPVFVDDREVGLGPLVELRMEAGTHRVEARGECLQSKVKSVSIRRGRRTSLKFHPRPRTRTVEIHALDDAGRSVMARVSVDGKTVGRAPGRFELDACASNIEVKGPGGIWMGPLSFADKGVTTLDVNVAGGSRPGEMAFVPAGWFMMGCNEAADQGCDEDEKPYHRVWLDSYYVDVAEVTIAMYRRCVEAGACVAPQPGAGCNWGEEGRDTHPANCTNWFQAGAYCAWVGKQLPTEAQWEKAARGVDGRIWPWGNEAPTCEHCAMGEGGVGCGTGGTLPVCSKPAGRTPYGACDMAGNVMEWVEDPQDADFYRASPERNPVNPGGDKSRLHCLRGGERAYTIVNFLRTSNRDGLQPDFTNYGIGFRCTKWAK